MHVAKTAGSSIVNILAYRYDRVCSNKVNSILLRQKGEWYDFETPWDHKNYFMGRLDECDYVSQEEKSSLWTS